MSWSTSRASGRGLVAAMAIVSIVGGARDAAGFVRYVSSTGNPYAWRSACVGLTAYPQGLLGSMTLTQIASATTKATDAWSRRDPALSACSALDLTLTLAPASVPGPVTARDGQNTIAFRDTNWEAICISSGSGVQSCNQAGELALTTVFARASGEIVEADVEVNAWDYTWADLDVVAPNGALADLQNALTHEMGHFVGFDHTCTENASSTPAATDSTGQPVPVCASADAAQTASTLFPVATPGDTARRTLTADDQQGVCAAYPLAAGPASCAGSAGAGGGVPVGTGGIGGGGIGGGAGAGARGGGAGSAPATGGASGASATQPGGSGCQCAVTARGPVGSMRSTLVLVGALVITGFARRRRPRRAPRLAHAIVVDVVKTEGAFAGSEGNADARGAEVVGECERPVVDVTLVDAMLSLTPEERLRQNDRLLRTIRELRDGFAARRSDDAAVETRRSGR